jgi:hypothetical protein
MFRTSFHVWSFNCVLQSHKLKAKKFISTEECIKATGLACNVHFQDYMIGLYIINCDCVNFKDDLQAAADEIMRWKMWSFEVQIFTFCSSELQHCVVPYVQMF